VGGGAPAKEPSASEVSSQVSAPLGPKRADTLADYTVPAGYSKNLQRIVNFDANAPIAECFKSVLKVYRIMQPDTVVLEDKGLEDEHLVALVEFLDKKEMVRTLNLRRNNISNVGAIALAEFLIYRDDTLIEVNLNRNRITHAGVERLLDAVHATIRLQKFGISFGNYVSATQAAAFE
jgi:Ran GTPase-activating protein (RanGAP) involved in mRNA processing and transport